MAGISLDIQLKDEEARSRLEQLFHRLDNRRPMLEAIGDLMVRSASDNFRNERGPDGLLWAPLKPATIKARQRKGQLPLTILRTNSKGRAGSSLAGSISREATNDEVRIGSTSEYAAIHQLGGQINKPARSAKIYRMKDSDGNVGRRFVAKDKANHVTDVTIPAHSITIPARRFLGASKEDEAEISEAIEDWLTR